MPLPTPDDTDAYYRRHAADYARRADGIDLTPMLAPLLAALRPGSRVLDLGCGSGRDARYLAGLGHRVIGADPCAEMLALARAASPTGAPTAPTYVQARVPDLPFADACFDAVWACASLLHVPRGDLPAALAACRRVLRPGGRLAILVKEGDGEVDDNRRLCVLWRIDDLVARVRAAGFEIELAVPRPSFDERAITWLQVLASC